MLAKQFEDAFGTIGLTPVKQITPVHFFTINSTLLDNFLFFDKSGVLLYNPMDSQDVNFFNIFMSCNFLLFQENLTYGSKDFPNLTYNLIYTN